MKKTELEQIIRELISSRTDGMLSTYNPEEDYPFGSVVRYIVGHDSQPVFLLSRIAEHSKYLREHPNASLLVSGACAGAEENSENVQQIARVTLVGRMVKPDEAERAQHKEDYEKYFAAFPETREYFDMLDFDFYRLELIKARYVGGFARAHWYQSGEKSPE